MSAVIATVLGGSQALSRSLFSRMIPEGLEASFFAIYEISESGTSWIGPLVFAVVVATTNSYRDALLSLLALLAVGTLLLLRTHVETAFVEAKTGGGAPRPPSGGSPSWFLRLLDEARGWMARTAVHVFFREVTYLGQERLSKETPLLLVANHNNAVVDSFLLLALGRTNPRILAKSPLFSHPFMGPLLRVARALPVFRPEDGADVSQNFETFSRCHQILAQRGCVALFPEGTSHNLRGQLPLRTGAARIALGAERSLGPLGVHIVPVALSYDAKGSFRSKAWVRVGQPISVEAFAAMHQGQPASAVRALTERIAAGLKDSTQPRADHEAHATPRTKRPLPLKVLSAPLVLLGCVFNWFPYRVPGLVANRLARTADEPGTYKLITGLLVFPLVWVAEAIIACCIAGPFGGLAVAVAAPASGYLALRLRDEA
jgi:1-acyl-sn-glycerol-3-phosphate acyltransferase